MQDDYLAFLTLDVKKNNVNLEIFNFKNFELKPLAHRTLLSRKKADSWNSAVDFDRKYICIFLYNNVSVTILTTAARKREFGQAHKCLLHQLSDSDQKPRSRVLLHSGHL